MAEGSPLVMGRKRGLAVTRTVVGRSVPAGGKGKVQVVSSVGDKTSVAAANVLGIDHRLFTIQVGWRLPDISSLKSLQAQVFRIQFLQLDVQEPAQQEQFFFFKFGWSSKGPKAMEKTAYKPAPFDFSDVPSFCFELPKDFKTKKEDEVRTV
jgi:hypothetical protein